MIISRILEEGRYGQRGVHPLVTIEGDDEAVGEVCGQLFLQFNDVVVVGAGADGVLVEAVLYETVHLFVAFELLAKSASLVASGHWAAIRMALLTE